MTATKFVAVTFMIAGALAGCGRFGFALEDDEGRDGAPDTATDGAPDSVLPVCTPMARQTLTTSGLPLGGAGARVASFAPLDDTTLGALWADTRSGGFGDVFFTTISIPSGAMSANTPVTASSSEGKFAPLLIPVSGGAIAIWGAVDFTATMIDATGAHGAINPVNDASATGASKYGFWAFDAGSEVVVITGDQRDGSPGMYLSRLDRTTAAKIGTDIDLSVTAEAQVIGAAQRQNELAIVYFATSFSDATFGRRTFSGAVIGTDVPIAAPVGGSADIGLAWGDGRWALASSTPTNEVIVTFLDDTGTPLGPSIELSTDRPTRTDIPAIAWLGDSFGVAWREIGALGYRRIASDGQFVGATEIEMNPSGDANNPDVTALASGAVVTWSYGPTSENFDVLIMCP